MKTAESSRHRGRAIVGAPSSPPYFEFSAGTGRHRVWGTSFLSHQGLAVNLVGGDVPHIGAVAVSIPRPSLANPSRRSATTSVFAVVGHKEDELARPLASVLARALGLTTVVVAGVHIHRARAADILKVFESAGRALQTIITTVRTDPGYSLHMDGSDSGASETRRRPTRRRNSSSLMADGHGSCHEP